MIESLCAIFRDVYTPQVVSKIHLIRDWYHGFGFCFRGYYRPFGPVILSLSVTSLCRVGGGGAVCFMSTNYQGVSSRWPPSLPLSTVLVPCWVFFGSRFVLPLLIYLFDIFVGVGSYSPFVYCVLVVFCFVLRIPGISCCQL